MDWIYLFIAGLCEAGFTYCLGKARLSSGYEMRLWYVVFVLFMLLSLWLMLRAIRTIPVGTAYGIWTGIGAVSAALLGIFVFKEPVTFWRIFFITTLIISLIGLKLSSH